MVTWHQYRSWLGDLAAGEPPQGAAPELASLATDSRSIGNGQWFVPITGDAFDGHKFIPAAMAAGASGFFYDVKRASELPQHLLGRGYAVRDPLAAFQQAASGWRMTLKHLRLAALTGSSGKTTTKEMLSGIMRCAGSTYATQASFNNEIGVPKTLQQLTPEHRYAALEFGARMPGNISFLCGLGKPDVAGLINVGTAHLGIFGSPEALLKTKLEIFRDSPAHATLVAYGDDPRILNGAKATGKPTLTFGMAPDSDARLDEAQWHDDGTMTVRLTLGGLPVAARMGVSHTALPINAAAAAAMALAANVDADSIVRGLQGYKGIKGRYQVHRLSDMTLIDDTYNANPDSMKVGLDTIGRAFAKSDKVLVLGDMLELGEGSSSEHRRIGATLVAQLHPVQLLTVGPDAKHLAEGAISAGLAANAVHCYDTVEDLIADGVLRTRGGPVVYAKGSNGMKLSRLVDQLLAHKGALA